MSEELEKLRHKQCIAERKLTAAKHKEKRLQNELKRLTGSERNPSALHPCRNVGDLFERAEPS